MARAHSAYAAGFPWRPLRRMFITRLHRGPTSCDRLKSPLTTHSPRNAGRRCPLQIKGARVHSTHKGEETGAGPGRTCDRESRRDNAPPIPTRAPCLRPLGALPQRFRNRMRASVFLKTPGAYTRVGPLILGLKRPCMGPRPHGHSALIGHKQAKRRWHSHKNFGVSPAAYLQGPRPDPGPFARRAHSCDAEAAV